jgi:hypothetical protein
MSNLSRRSLVASAAALPALAVPAVAIASIEPDPIFAAIEKERVLSTAFIARCRYEVTWLEIKRRSRFSRGRSIKRWGPRATGLLKR